MLYLVGACLVTSLISLIVSIIAYRRAMVAGLAAAGLLIMVDRPGWLEPIPRAPRGQA